MFVELFGFGVDLVVVVVVDARSLFLSVSSSEFSSESSGESSSLSLAGPRLCLGGAVDAAGQKPLFGRRKSGSRFGAASLLLLRNWPGKLSRARSSIALLMLSGAQVSPKELSRRPSSRAHAARWP